MSDELELMKISNEYSVAAQIAPQDIEAIAAAGFKDVICNRPDGEDPGQPTAAEIASSCKTAGIGFHHIPISGMPMSVSAVQRQREIISESAGPVLGYCRSGQRSAIIFEAST